MLFRSLDSLDNELPGNYNYESFWTASQLHSPPRIDNSLLHYWNVEDLVISLRTNFRLTYLDSFTKPSACGTDILIEKEKDFSKFLYDLRHRSNTFQKFHYIDGLFEVPLLSLEMV